MSEKFYVMFYVVLKLFIDFSACNVIGLTK